MSAGKPNGGGATRRSYGSRSVTLTRPAPYRWLYVAESAPLTVSA